MDITLITTSLFCSRHRGDICPVLPGLAYLAGDAHFWIYDQVLKAELDLFSCRGCLPPRYWG